MSLCRTSALLHAADSSFAILAIMIAGGAVRNVPPPSHSVPVWSGQAQSGILIKCGADKDVPISCGIERVGHLKTLDLLIGVRIPASQFIDKQNS